MEKEEAHFKNLLKAAEEAGNKLKFVASFENGKASVGLQHIDPTMIFIICMEKIMSFCFIPIVITLNPW